jgi:hypothetical protein
MIVGVEVAVGVGMAVGVGDGVGLGVADAEVVAAKATTCLGEALEIDTF